MVSQLLGKDEVYTPLGPIRGTSTEVEGIKRYVIEYAQAERWKPSYPTQGRIKGLNKLPPVCPQQATNTLPDWAVQSEDCLYLTIYAPSSPASGSPKKDLPTLFWIHGGSFVSGSSSHPGLDGSILAAHGEGTIVVMIQYRLGVLGMLPPDDIYSTDPNLGLNDIKTGLRFFKGLASSFGGDPDKITVGGHSSGGHMIRGLLASPEMEGTFRAAIIQSDPMAFGFATPAITTQIQRRFFRQTDGFSHGIPRCTGDDLECWKNVSADELVAAQGRLIEYLSGEGVIPGVPSAEVLRPTSSTPSLSRDIGKALLDGQPMIKVPLLLTTVSAEFGSTIQAIAPSAIPDLSTYNMTVQALFGERTAEILLNDVPEYDINNPISLNQARLAGIDDMRAMLIRMGTDAVWRSPIRDFARMWTQRGEGDVWMGEWQRGERYPSNAGGNICRQGVVCHEDELLPTFGQGPADLTSETIARWSAFVHRLDPNPKTSVTSDSRWEKYDGSARSIFPIGGSIDGREILECPSVWGTTIPYDWQLYA
ncbi:hypothetical protein FFLO_02471 [Filobasidium floriforme]|uniref:Carboxylic ester hydrolase n=1 Tax=Filobasidium floriforme TaxID=5210 RepID=A0A8K0JNV5_9TREE|nr:hypothetical protein FFLO_02471 [Filobasidium floriforme]